MSLLFPNEVWLEIFKYFTTKERLRLRSVCRVWNDLCLLDFNEITLRNNDFYGEQGFEIVKENLFRDDRNCDHLCQLIPKAGRSLLSWAIILDKDKLKQEPRTNKCCQRLVDCLIRHCPNLTDIILINLSKSTYLVFERLLLHFSRQLKNLHLHFDDTCFYPKDDHFARVLRSFENLRELFIRIEVVHRILPTVYGIRSLEYLKLDLGIIPGAEMEKSLYLQYLTGHPKLKTFSIEMFDDFSSILQLRRLEPIKSVERAEILIEDTELNEPDKGFKSALANFVHVFPNVSDLFYVDPYVDAQIIRQQLPKLRRLEKLHVCGYFSQDERESLLKEFKALKHAQFICHRQFWSNN